jgi:hypothetical protein
LQDFGVIEVEEHNDEIGKHAKAGQRVILTNLIPQSDESGDGKHQENPDDHCNDQSE